MARNERSPDAIESILKQARAASESEWGELAIQLARRLLARAESETEADEGRRSQELGERLARRESQVLSTVLTDRVHRSKDAARVVETVRRLTHRFSSLDFLPPLDRLELRALRAFGPLVPELTATALQERLRREASPYVVDATPEEMASHLERRRQRGMRVNLNYLGEEILGERQAEKHIEEYLSLLARPDVDAISVKLSSVFSQVSVLAFESTVARVTERLRRVFSASLAARPRKLIYFDMEAFKDFELTLAVFERLLLDPDFRDVQAGIAVQAYLPDSSGAVERLIALGHERARRGAAPPRVRLVKGANLAMERVEASLHRWAVPVFPTKVEVDAQYKRLVRRLFHPEMARVLHVGVGSHNLFDVAYALVLRAHHGVEDRVELEMLEGMAEPLARVVAQAAGGLLLYAPAVLPEHFSSAISYLVRRLDENSSEENYLRHAFSMRVGDDAFEDQRRRFEKSLGLSGEAAVATRRDQDRALSSENAGATALVWKFDNAADTDFTRHANREWIESALAEARTRQHVVRPRVAGEDLDGEDHAGFDPSRPNVEAYREVRASAQQIEHALEVAARARSTWARVPASERAAILGRVAELLEARRGRLIAAMVLDAGKRVVEADVEVSEAVDFARFYATSFLSWHAEFSSTPLGTIVIAPPWNFPLAIPIGGCLAALVSGNTVLFKPAPETPLVGRALAEVLWDAGVPPEAFGFVPCSDDVASPLIVDERVSAVVLTGATETAHLFLKMRPGLRLFAETGGKNGAYVSAVSDREQAIAAIVQSAFGHAGQKCSALSVLVLEREVYRDEGFRAELADATESLIVGSAWELDSFVTPLIRPPAGELARVLATRERGESWLVEPRVSTANERLLSPGILLGARRGSRAHQSEFFGPVLSVFEARDLDDGLEVLNATPYGLTAGFFGMDEIEQERFIERMDAGNLYLNRSLTGAVVGRQPFGGRKASGFGPGAKAGGPNYVAQFCHWEPRSRKIPAGQPRKERQGENRGAGLDPYAFERLVSAWSDEERVELATRRRSYDYALVTHFQEIEPGTDALGEENFLRYQPARVALVVGPGDLARSEEIDFIGVWTALARAEGKSAVFAHVGSSLVARAGVPSASVLRYSNASELAARLVELGFERARFFAQEVPAELRTTTVHVVEDPVADDGRLELRHYFLEQAVSLSFHRAGNLSAGSLRARERARR